MTLGFRSLGLFCLVVCVLAWTVQSLFVAAVQRVVHCGPYFVLYCAHSSLFLFFPIQLAVEKLLRPGMSVRDHLAKQSELIRSTTGLSLVGFLGYGALLSAIFNFSSYTWYLAINWLPVYEVTIIFNTTTAFVFVFSLWLLGERWNCVRLIAVCISMVGVVFLTVVDKLVSSNDQLASSATSLQHSLGGLLLLAGAAGMGLYEVLFKKLTAPNTLRHSKSSNAPYCTIVSIEESAAVDDFAGELDMPKVPAINENTRTIRLAAQLSALIGFFTLVLCWIPMMPLHFADIERFTLPKTLASVGFIASNSVLSFLFNGCLLWGIVLTSPIYASTAVLATIPIVTGIDFLLDSRAFGLWAAVGSSLIFIGIAILTFNRH